MDIPMTIINIVAVEYSERIPAYVDSVENFVFYGEPTQAEIDDMHQCVTEMVLERTESMTNLGVEIELASQLKEGQQVSIEFPQGHVSTHWSNH